MMERFYSKTKRSESGCLEWQAYRQKQGYGVFRMSGKTWLAHRAAWTIENGDIPDGMQVNHKCDNPCCVDVDHLYIGTQAENMADMDRGGRANRVCGERHYAAKITREQAKRIKKMLEVVPRYPSGQVKFGELNRIADEVGAPHRIVQMISSGDSWRHL